MKKIVLLAMLLMVCMTLTYAQKIIVKGDRELGTDFGKYKTFNWANHAGLDNNGIYFLNDLIFKADIREAVEHEMQGLGYKLQPQSPDLIVNFRVFDQKARIKGYEGYGQGYWGSEEFRQASDTASYVIEPGTLLVSLVDRKNGTLVWQGFASGLINNKEFIKDHEKIKEAVNLIFEEYGMRATDYDRSSR
jgi:hypothetical protein